ncbi:endonuclease/exonuclease/phosphatase family protein [Treponema primitia ZAS-2]|uniref:Endonuclease/exonuclease/phosphatase family protein n=1 Tax=Treponema primitia (strain ATCC BAA-887 / DSM 12427 / ZAS-2) TaxID=545694 RepID=F5YP31_TREPZ|nr:endonuclease/exonuclease/phosphatase family protein [Treponema primitia]AEF86127.1 endonuclease/exonuclease/phosphatase family protein [Treponema primitia ZAS-2]
MSKLRIVSWNCHYGFSEEKQKTIMEADIFKGADIYIIPECKKSDWERLNYPKQNADWYSDGKDAKDSSGGINEERDLGIGIFCKNDITINRLAKYWSDDPSFRYVLPYQINKDGKDFILFAVWTKNKTDVTDPLDYVQKAHAAVDYYKNKNLLTGDVILIGDFNSNEIWDDCYKSNLNHTALVKKLSDYYIVNSAKKFDKEKIETYFYTYKSQKKKVTDDYCFISKPLLEKVTDFHIGDSKEWVETDLSDHCPIMVEFTL